MRGRRESAVVLGLLCAGVLRAKAESLDLSPAARVLLPLMDGTRDRAALVARWAGDPGRVGLQASSSAAEDVDALLRWLAGMAVAAAPEG